MFVCMCVFVCVCVCDACLNSPDPITFRRCGCECGVHMREFAYIRAMATTCVEYVVPVDCC